MVNNDTNITLKLIIANKKPINIQNVTLVYKYNPHKRKQFPKELYLEYT